MEVEKMKKRLFLITTTTNGKNVILGYIESNSYPSRLTNDKEYAKEKFMHEFLKVTEVTKRCHIEY
jgi:hypothetical protein